MTIATINALSKTAGSNSDFNGVAIGTGMTVDQTNDALQSLGAMLASQLGPVNAKSTDIPSAATTDLAGANGQVVDITGTNTITAFGGSGLPAGMLFWCRFPSGLTLTHHATDLISATGANVVMQAGDIALMVSLGASKWRILQTFAAASSGVPTGTVVAHARAAATAPSGWLLCNGQAVSRTGYATLFAEISTTYGVGDGATTFNVPDLRGRVVAGRDTMGASAASRMTTAVFGANTDTAGSAGGTQTHTLITAELASHSHSISITTGTESANHTHAVSGSTGTESADHSHAVPSLVTVHSVTASTTAVQGTSGPNNGSISTGGISANHSHSFSVTSGTVSAFHTHLVSGTSATAGSGSAHLNTQPTMMMNRIIKT